MRYEPGTPAQPGQIPLSVPEIRGNEWAYVKQCLDSGWVSSAGKFIEHFESRCAELAGRRFGVAVCNGTAALHTALLVAGIGPDDEVLVSDLTFVAPANAIRYVGAWPVFVDAESLYWQMDPRRAADFLANSCRTDGGKLVNKTTGRRVRAIIPAHILGHPVHLEPILELARKYDLLVIEDAAEALGAKYQQRPVGSGGDAAVLSFNGNKIITCGGGGVLVTDRQDWADKARYLTTQAKDDPVEFAHDEIGYNYRLTNVQAAIGLGQLEMLDEYVAIKRRIAETYRRALECAAGITPMNEAHWAFSTYWLYTILIDPAVCKVDRREAMRRLGERGIQSRPLWQPMHLNKCFRDCPPGDCPVATALAKQALSIPCSVGLSPQDQQRVIDSLLEILHA